MAELRMQVLEFKKAGRHGSIPNEIAVKRLLRPRLMLLGRVIGAEYYGEDVVLIQLKGPGSIDLPEHLGKFYEDLKKTGLIKDKELECAHQRFNHNWRVPLNLPSTDLDDSLFIAMVLGVLVGSLPEDLNNVKETMLAIANRITAGTK